MSYEVRWYDRDKTIILYVFHDQLNETTFAQAIRDARRMAIQQEHTIDLIVDLRESDIGFFSMLRGGHFAENLTPANVRHFVIVTESSGRLFQFVKTMVTLGKQLGSRIAADCVFVHSVEEAVAFIDAQPTSPRDP